MKFRSSLSLLLAPLAVCMDPEPGQGGGGTATAPAAPAPQGDVLQKFQPVIQHVTDTIKRETQSLRDEHTKLVNRVEQLAAPANNPGFGIVRGPLPGRAERQGYSYGRAYGLKMGYIEQANAKVELDLSNRLRKLYFEQGALMSDNPRSVMVPLGSELLVEEQSNGEQKQLPLAAEVRQMLADGIAGADLDEFRWMTQRIGGKAMVRQALSQFDDTGMGIFTHGGTQGELITLLRARELMSRVGCREVALPPNGRLPFPAQTGATTAYYVGERQIITASEPTTGRGLELIAKKLAALVKLPNELIRFASPSAEAFIRDDIAKVIALKSSQQQVDGVGSTVAVKGLITYNGINTMLASTVDTNGNTFQPLDVSRMLAILEELEFDLEMDPATFVMRPLMHHVITERRAAAHTAGTLDGPYLFPANRDDIAKGLPPMLRGTRVVKGTQISGTRSKGGSSVLTYILCGVFSQWVHGRAGVLEFASTDRGDTSFAYDETWMRAIMHHDAGPLRENAFVLCDTLVQA